MIQTGRRALDRVRADPGIDAIDALRQEEAAMLPDAPGAGSRDWETEFKTLQRRIRRPLQRYDGP